MSDYFGKIVEVMTDYLGPAAERFVRRQIEVNLHKPPEELTVDDVRALTLSVRKAFGLLKQDRVIVDEAAERIFKVTA